MNDKVSQWLMRIFYGLMAIAILWAFGGALYLALTLETSEYFTLATRWVYIFSNAASFIAIVAAAVGVLWNKQRQLILMLLLVAVLLFIGGMVCQMFVFYGV